MNNDVTIIPVFDRTKSSKLANSCRGMYRFFLGNYGNFANDAVLPLKLKGFEKQSFYIMYAAIAPHVSSAEYTAKSQDLVGCIMGAGDLYTTTFYGPVVYSLANDNRDEMRITRDLLQSAEAVAAMRSKMFCVEPLDVTPRTLMENKYRPTSYGNGALAPEYIKMVTPAQEPACAVVPLFRTTEKIVRECNDVAKYHGVKFDSRDITSLHAPVYAYMDMDGNIKGYGISDNFGGDQRIYIAKGQPEQIVEHRISNEISKLAILKQYQR